MGNTRYYTKDNGQSFAELEYDVWGAVTSPGKLNNNDNGNFAAAVFTGHPYDTVLDIYFAEARFYDAKYRQWMASDPIKDGLNWYLYVEANPVTFFDPNGKYYIYLTWAGEGETIPNPQRTPPFVDSGKPPIMDSGTPPFHDSGSPESSNIGSDNNSNHTGVIALDNYVIAFGIETDLLADPFADGVLDVVGTLLDAPQIFVGKSLSEVLNIFEDGVDAFLGDVLSIETPYKTVVGNHYKDYVNPGGFLEWIGERGLDSIIDYRESVVNEGLKNNNGSAIIKDLKGILSIIEKLDFIKSASENMRMAEMNRYDLIVKKLMDEAGIETYIKLENTTRENAKKEGLALLEKARLAANTVYKNTSYFCQKPFDCAGLPTFFEAHLAIQEMTEQERKNILIS